ncbi:beta-N-acetylglucosaminidase NAG3 isoform X2 [Leptinotarsa decemlineata]|uniref:beta-N-acetylglucosaminidase NAG3 isoform X2 n=1 Tax=Leptinotarsa decemlineata TaxID=7539 RepID=UPI003D3091AD
MCLVKIGRQLISHKMNNCKLKLLFLFMVCFVVGVIYCTRIGFNRDSYWTYQCSNSVCHRSRVEAKIMTLETCNMMCGTPSLWPLPRSMNITSKTSSTIDINKMVTRFHAPVAVKTDLKKAFRIFKRNLICLKNNYIEAPAREVQVIIFVANDVRKLKLSTDESYSLKVKYDGEDSILANISASTYFGARHALETLSQLIWLDTDNDHLKILHDVDIEDGPEFPYRGIMIDTARNYFAIDSLRKVVDGMAATKLNVLHLHLTDAVSFPIVLPTIPELAKYGAYGPDKIYTAEDIKDLIEYARIRGIRTILEVDAPGHVNEGWNRLNKRNGKLIICGETEVTSGQLNPDNPNTLKILRTIYEDLFELGTDAEMFHIGGDEVDMNCYAQTEAAKKFKDINQFWMNLTKDIFEAVVEAHADGTLQNLIIWSSPLTDQYLSQLNYSKNVVVQFWYGNPYSMIQNGNKIIFSTVGNWYLDCGFGSWRPQSQDGSCDPYTPWQTFYKYRPWWLYAVPEEQTLGGEACLWTEQVDEATLETRLWPRAAAFAERVWSDPAGIEFDSYDVSTRISAHRDRLISRGFEVAAIWPLWCTQNPGRC